MGQRLPVISLDIFRLNLQNIGITDFGKNERIEQQLQEYRMFGKTARGEIRVMFIEQCVKEGEVCQHF